MLEGISIILYSKYIRAGGYFSFSSQVTSWIGSNQFFNAYTFCKTYKIPWTRLSGFMKLLFHINFLLFIIGLTLVVLLKRFVSLSKTSKRNNIGNLIFPLIISSLTWLIIDIILLIVYSLFWYFKMSLKHQIVKEETLELVRSRNCLPS